MPPVPEEFLFLRDWIGRTETRADLVTAHPLAALAATLDREDAAPVAGDAIPPLAHWLYFLGAERQSRLGEDGHPMRGGFLPPVPLPRRMFAGGSVEFLQPIRLGDRVERVAKIAAVTHKEGRDGPLVFVTVQHEVFAEGALALTEEQNIVYREAPKATASATAETVGTTMARVAQWRTSVTADEVMLFRFSALTFNSHRIHYDRSYATQVEGYPGLVVHGPLVATLLADLVRRNVAGETLRSLCFRAKQPLFAGSPFTICGSREGKSLELWAEAPDGSVAMNAAATLA